MKIKSLPLVSVVIPVFNGAKFINEAIDSVFAQGYPNIEVIIIDDGSTDDSHFNISKYENIYYQKQQNSGPAIARNVGCRIARGEYIAFLDQDDVWLPRKLEKQIACFEQSPEIGIVLCYQKTIFEKDYWGPPLSIGALSSKNEGNVIASFSPSALMIRRSLLNDLGGFNESYPLYSEADFFLRIREIEIPLEVHPEVLLVKRFHQTNMSYRTNVTSVELLGIARDSVVRKKLRNCYGRT